MILVQTPTADEMLEFQTGMAYAFAPHNFHPLSPVDAGIQVYEDPSDPFAWGYLTGATISVVPFAINPSGRKTEWTSISAFVYLNATKGGGATALAVPMAASQIIDLQVKAGKHIASGGTQGKDMYTGSRRYEDTAEDQGHNLVWTGGGGGIQI